MLVSGREIFIFKLFTRQIQLAKSLYNKVLIMVEKTGILKIKFFENFFQVSFWKISKKLKIGDISQTRRDRGQTRGARIRAQN